MRLLSQLSRRLIAAPIGADKRRALEFALEASSGAKDETGLVLWTDASATPGRLGEYACAAVMRRGDAWRAITSVVPSTNSNTAEAHAILLALDVAARHITAVDRPKPVTSVDIFSDCILALKWVAGIEAGDMTGVPADAVQGLRHVGVLGRELRRRTLEVQLHWVPRGRVEGNKEADKAARRARRTEMVESSCGRALSSTMASQS